MLDKQGAQFLENLVNVGSNSDTTRDEFTKLVHKHFATAFPKYGIMVIHSGQDLVSAPDKSYAKFHLEYQKTFGTEGFEIYVVRKGSKTVITNTGDGGYWNWCFSGHANRDGKTITF